jgi:NitT/TauT family transport system substrate-binding protein
MQDFKKGSIDAAFLTLDEVLLLHKDGVKLKIIYAIDTSNGADAILAKKEIKDISSLKGKSVAYAPKSVQEYLLFRALQIHKMSMYDIRPVLLKYDEQLDAYKRNAFDAIATFEPMKSKLLESGLHSLFSSRDIPNEIVDLLVVREDVLTHSKETLQQTVSALAKSVKTVQNKPSAYTVVAMYLQTTPQNVKSALTEITLLNQGKNRQLLDSLKKQNLELKKLVDLEFLPNQRGER